MVDRYLEHLAQVPLFRGSSKSDLRKIAQATDEIDVEAGRELISEGDVGREAFVIVAGEASVQRGGQEIATLVAGDPFGEIALLDRAPRNATVVAKTPMTVLVLSQSAFHGLLAELPDFSRTIMAALASRLREKDKELIG